MLVLLADRTIFIAEDLHTRRLASFKGGNVMTAILIAEVG